MQLLHRRLRRFASACWTLAAVVVPTTGHASAPADVHFGLDLNRAVAADSIYTHPTGGAWTYHHVYPLALPLIGGGSWQPDADFQVQTTQSQGLDLVFTVHTAVSASVKSAYPADTLTWKSRVQSVVERYDGDGYQDMPGLTRPVKYWHVEQEMSFWLSTWPQYVTYLGATRRAILAADPTAHVVSIGLDSAQLWGEAHNAGYVSEAPSANQTFTQSQLDNNQTAVTTILQGGGYDILDVHSYEEANIVKGKMDFVRSLMPNPATPIWCIESGGPYLRRDQGYSDTLNAQMVVRLFTEAFACGVERYNIYLYQFGSGAFATEPWNNMPLTNGGTAVTSLKPSYYAYQQMTRKLSGFTSVQDLTSRAAPIEDDNVFHIRFTTNGKPVDVYWSGIDSTVSAPVNAATALITHIPTKAGDTSTNTRVDTVLVTNGAIALRVTSDPVYVEEGAAAPVAIGVPAATPGYACQVISASREATLRLAWRAPRGVTGLHVVCATVGGRAMREWAVIGDAGTIDWDRRDAGGDLAPTGVYLIALHDGRMIRARARVLSLH